MNRIRLIEIYKENKYLSDEQIADIILDEMEKDAAQTQDKAGAPDELTEDEIRYRARVLILNQGWRPGQQMSGYAVGELMTKFGMSLLRERPQDRCAHPDCGCDADSVCSAALTLSAPIAAPVRDDGARDIEDLCNSVLGNCYLGKGPEEALATKIKASLRSAPASAVPREAQKSH